MLREKSRPAIAVERVDGFRGRVWDVKCGRGSFGFGGLMWSGALLVMQATLWA